MRRRNRESTYHMSSDECKATGNYLLFVGLTQQREALVSL